MRIISVTVTILLLLSTVSFAEGSKMKFDFETDSMRGWKIPDWAYEQGDHVARSLEISPKMASKGKNSLEMMCEFPGDYWTAALIDYENDLDLTGYKTISADIFVPKEAQGDLYMARIILTVGDEWIIMEMKDPVPLIQGKWITVTANIDRNEGWRTVPRGMNLLDYVKKVKKVAVRVEYNANPWQGGPPYSGPVYIDNIVIE
jgi:hypothetical protein